MIGYDEEEGGGEGGDWLVIVDVNGRAWIVRGCFV